MLRSSISSSSSLINDFDQKTENKTDGGGKYLLTRDAIGDGVGDATEYGVGDIVGEAVESEKRDLEWQEDDPVAPFANFLYGSK
ncbi:hypothetical protein L2E82_04789 [Cichorium intybus]|uniref:Uncharacterized protein n=1 Tax=Cichorium intybus TaxID=13427 RepID=A0ACB9H866_CICIN|nr:hypothetical protein L2E82_04789 [Cichorium intybus]